MNEATVSKPRSRAATAALVIDDMTALSGWQNFYVIVGSAAGALIGLQFVVMTLIANIPITRTDARGANAFTTPTVVHFGVVLLLSAVACVPWNEIAAFAVLWGLVGLIGVVYVVLVGRRLRFQSAYQTVFEDRLFHVLLPFMAYAMLAVAACAAYYQTHHALFLVGTAALLLLFIGIHNAWDIITYHVFVKGREHQETDRHQ
jgi:hypothetical protein